MKGKHESETVIIEKGGFERYYYRKGKKAKHKTVRHKSKNPEKVTLANIGNLELYVYPYQHPDKVFIGVYPYSQTLSKSEVSALLGFYNKARWFLQEKWTKKAHFTKRAKIDSTLIQKAYGEGLDKLKKEEK
ncbi:MAG: hypothetical protein QMD13_09390 [Candidatus Bathyarchaeia archaeon]|nr:hypothetical protein [Candidatus Bathyarchaeia archaeon]